MRCLAPAGGFPSPVAVFKTSFEPNLLTAIKNLLEALYSGQPLSLCSSGKQGIEIISQYLSSKGYNRLVLGAYGCPDIVAAAVRGGLKVRLVDIDSRTLEPKFAEHDPHQEVLLLSNLYGLVDSVAGLLAYKVIDDACQAALSFDDNLRVGGRGLGVLSFGRGKAVCSIGGGAIIGFGETPEVYPERLISISRLLAYSVLERPALYGIPASLPFLKLGETRFDPEYKDHPLCSGQIASAFESIRKFDAETKTRRYNQELWIKALEGLDLVLPVTERKFQSKAVLTRFPILVRQNREQVFNQLVKAGLGASISYPRPLDRLCEGYVEGGNFEGANKVAMQIITLPTHRYVTERDIYRAAEIIKKYA